MDDVRFFDRAGPFTLAEIAGAVGAEITGGDGDQQIANVATLDAAGPGDISFFDNPRYAAELESTAASACIVSRRARSSVPDRVAALIAARPSEAFARVAGLFYPAAQFPLGILDGPGPIDPSARLAGGVTVEAGAIVGAEAEIGEGTRILAGSVIGRRVRIGRNCTVGPNATVTHALIGDRVIIHPGVSIGQDGFGFASSANGHRKIPQVGRVIIQDDVEIGANTTVDRGALRDTVIGEGTKIDNQVQIAHNVVIGRHCVIVAQVALAGSARLGDFVAIGGKAGVMNHLTVGDGAQVATLSAVRTDLAPGGRYGGVPARPVRDWLKEVAALQKLAQEHLAGRGREGVPGEDGRDRDDG